MSTTDFLFSNSAPSVWTSPTYTNTTTPDWWQAASQGLISKASQIAGQDYQPFTGPKVASPSDLQTAAYGDINAAKPAVNNAFTSASTALSSAATPFDANTFNQFLNPYTKNVTDRIAELGGRNLSENLLPQVNDTFIKAGQFGSSRNADFTNRAIRDTQDSVLGAQASALEADQNAAMQAYQNSQRNQLAAGAAQGALGQTIGNQNIAQTNAENTLGGQQQINTQNNLDSALNDFNTQKNYPQQMLDHLSAIIHGYAPPTSTTTYNTQGTNGGQSPLTSIVGALKQFGGSSNGATN